MSMGWAEAERAEHEAQMLEQDRKAGHKPGCLISVSPAYGGGYCSCGLFQRGVSMYDPINQSIQRSKQADYGWLMYFWGFLSGMFTLLILLGIMEWIGVL